MGNNPLPVSLASECKKAAKVAASWITPSGGLDHNIIPIEVLQQAKGLAFLTVTKAGFLFSIRAGSGLVIARLADGSWSAPSAIGTAGVGAGLMAGAEMAEFLIILNSSAAVRSFMASGSLTIGGNMSVAAGPIGRNVEATGSLSAKGTAAAMYSYSRTKGLYGGASVEGSILVERSDANGKAYNYAVTAAELLSGRAEVPEFALPLIDILERAIGSVADEWQADKSDIRPPPMDRGYSFGSQYASGGSDKAQKLGGGRLGFPAMGRARSKSSVPPRTRAELDPFGDGEEDAPGKGGPAVSRNGRFEHQFTSEFDGEGDKDREGERDVGDKAEGWKGKLTKPRSATVSGYGVAGWAANNSFDGRKSSFRGGSTLDSDEESSPHRAFTGTDDDASDFASGRSARVRPNLMPKKSSSRFLSFRGKSTPKAVDQSSMYNDPTRSPFADEFSDLDEPPRDRFERSGSGGGGLLASGSRSRSGSGSNRPPPTTTTYKPWDSDEDLTMAGLSLDQGSSPNGHDFLRPTPGYESPTAGRSRSGSLATNTRPSRSGSGASAGALHIRPVEADFASAAQGQRSHGFGVPSPQPRSRSNTAGGGVGTAVALFSFAGAGPEDLAFSKGDVITILAQDDEEWWRGRLKLKEGVVPRNYLEFHKNE